MVDNKLLPKLSQNLLEILNDDEYYDITIEVGNDPYVKVFRAHMVILHYRSPYLKRMLSTNKKKNDGILVQIKLPNISPEIFQIILRYIYGGELSLEEYDTSDIIKILDVANELSLQELVTHLQSFLIKNKVNWIEENFDLVYQTSFKNDSFLELQKYCTNLISEEPDKIFKSPNFSSIPEKLLLSLIKNDNLQMSEIQIWERVIKWGLAQNPALPSELTNYSKDDFKTLKNTLQQCIPFIRFYNLTCKEFMDKVIPYKKILPKKLYDDLLNTFLKLLDPDIKPTNKSKPRITKETNLNVKITTEYPDNDNFIRTPITKNERKQQKMTDKEFEKSVKPVIVENSNTDDTDTDEDVEKFENFISTPITKNERKQQKMTDKEFEKSVKPVIVENSNTDDTDTDEDVEEFENFISTPITKNERKQQNMTDDTDTDDTDE
ncbi:hypothetical protein C1645_879196 [Glomus cerebriforme]|uniref:BTB domain-containing protein n=1 Tax=Glomus cerebriforme TaxID=658196 RepID=A0A397SH84_9GLOM|nr:hypothetical protein C1645_879196 [Glomus cerebriforme]